MARSRSVYILYGSQTGQAEEIANQIHEEAIYKSYDAKVYCLKNEGKDFDINSVYCAVFVCSTTGDGELPENARAFVRKINRKTLPNDHLAHLRYALLGLGDTNYSTFCGGPKTLEKALKAHGAVHFLKSAFADDGTDLEMTVEPWIDDLFSTLEKHFDIADECNDGVIINNSATLNSFEKTENDLSMPNSAISSNLPNLCQNETTVNSFKDLTLDNSLAHSTTHTTAVQSLTKNDNASITEQSLEMCSVTDSLLLKSSISEPTLSLPPLMKNYLDAPNSDVENFDPENVSYQSGATFPISSSELINATVTNVRQLSSSDAVKKALEVELTVEEEFPYCPGDSFAICCENDKKEVEWLIDRLSYNAMPDDPLQLVIKKDTVKKNPVIPPYIPQPFSIRYAFSKCLEIRAVPKKPLLRKLANGTILPQERRCLEELCSRQGSEVYTRAIRATNICILDLLATFSTCTPSFETLVEHLPRLQPRRYSIASSHLVSPKKLLFVFNVVRIPADDGRTFSRNGVCTGMLENMSSSFLDTANAEKPLSDRGRKIQIFFTKSTGFRLPDDVATPIVMIGPGTGVAPFLGFLKHREASSSVAEMGKSWLFYGCRHKGRDYLYQSELESFKSKGVLTELIVAFSRDPQPSHSPKYVQDNLRLHSAAVSNLLLERKAVFYVCGDARNMAKDVRQCIVEIIKNSTNCDEESAMERFKQVVSEKRYREDIWS